MPNNNLTEAKIIGIVIQVFCSSFMFISLWGMIGFFVAVLLVILAIFILKPSIYIRKKTRSISVTNKAGNLDSHCGNQLLLFLLLFSNAVLGPVISNMFNSVASASLAYLISAGLLFYIIWKKLDLRN